MQMLNQKLVNKKLKKSQILLLGSLLVFLGFIVLTYDYIVKMKDEFFTSMELQVDEGLVQAEPQEETTDVPVANNLPEDSKKPNKKIDYSKYFGVLEIPKIGLKRGFYNIDSKYNSIEYNVTLVKGSNMPDVNNGNLILMAHSGWANISYFEYLYNLSLGDYAYITYKGKKYSYKLVNIYDVKKTGKVKIVRSYNKTTLTLITCTRNNDKAQTVYILELV